MLDLVYPKPTLSPWGDLYKSEENLVYKFKTKSLTVPAGFMYDGASIPWLFYEVIGTPFHPRFMPAALPHDWIYGTHEHEKEWVDELFYRILLQEGVNHLKAHAMYDAVRIFGHLHWHDRHNKNQ